MFKQQDTDKKLFSYFQKESDELNTIFLHYLHVQVGFNSKINSLSGQTTCDFYQQIDHFDDKN